jgi:inner membrane protein
MTWKSHIAIATAVCLPFNPAMLPISIIGSTAPDWSEWILKFFGIKVQHRGATHYLLVPLAFIAFSFIFDFRSMIFWFGIGYFTHWFADSLTISGVPLTPYDNSRIHFFGGKLRTGEMLEYIIAFSLLAVSVTIAKPVLNNFIDFEGESSFSVFSMDYEDLNKKGIIDNQEYLEKRFKFF